jgi:hypothetical protein
MPDTALALTRVVTRERDAVMAPMDEIDEILAAYVDGRLGRASTEIGAVIAADLDLSARVSLISTITGLLVTAYCDDLEVLAQVVAMVG